MNPAWWRGKHVFVPGHTGFKGAWLCLWLQSLGATLTGYALAAPSQPSLFEEAHVAGGMRSIEADVRDVSRLRDAIAKSGSSLILHLAAQSLVRRSYEEPLATYEINALGTANVLEAARSANDVRAIVIITSDKCYLPKPGRRHPETDPLGGNDPYAASKAAAEHVTSGYRAAYAASGSSVKIASARAGNVIGGGDWARDRLVPDLIAAFSTNRTAIVRNSSAVRPWQHVLDPLAGYLTLAERLHDDGDDVAQAWNFGPPEDHERMAGSLADSLAQRWGDGARWAHEAEKGGAAAPEEPDLRLDSHQAEVRLDWRSRIALDAALARVVRWHKGFDAGTSARALAEADIKEVWYAGL